MARGKRGRPKKNKERNYKPKLKTMVEVTPKNRKKLESRYGISIPDDVRYIVPPDKMLDEEFWDDRPDRKGPPRYREIIG